MCAALPIWAIWPAKPVKRSCPMAAHFISFRAFCSDDPDLAPDVIRGEEIQIAGALINHADWWQASRILLPGTHSKWVTMQGGKLESFSTYMTGEIFAVLCDHSILGRLMPEEKASKEEADKAFDLGLSIARDGGAGDLTHQLFATRTMGLTERLPKAALRSYLSGLLIGNELTLGHP